MRGRLLAVMTVGFLAAAAPAFADSFAGGTSTSGSSSSSSSISSSGGSSVGVVQGNVSGGSSVSGSSSSGSGTDQSGSSSSGGSVGGQVSGASPSALANGMTKKLPLPAMSTAREAVPASSTRGPAFAWALAAIVVAALAVLYRRLPRPVSS